MGGGVPESKGRGLLFDPQQHAFIGVLTSQRLLWLSIIRVRSSPELTLTRLTGLPAQRSLKTGTLFSPLSSEFVVVVLPRAVLLKLACGTEIAD